MQTENGNPEDIFHKAIEIAGPAEQAAYLDEACGKDEKLRVEVWELLKAHKEAGGFLEPVSIEADATLHSDPSIEGPGTKIGRYELLELIGEGGMGLVYLAEQKEPVRRKVVLKLIKPGMDSKQVVARFEAERQALAVLDHPNIAHVFDAGATTAGRPYFVMEYVRGMSITRYCDEHKLGIEQRLRLFEQVCEGVHHAHQKGIIHRDLKPSNILVSVHGDRAVPKIIDFGIAKAITQPLTDKTFVTLQGQLLGTPEYMSPEQVDLATQDIDTRSDIYSLGVVLYELLSGVLPFDKEYFAHAGLAEIQQTIRETEPPSPSVRLTNLGEKAQTIAASRGTHAVPLARCLHRELEWIPLKAMRKDRCRRYRSAFEMADDIHNYLTGRPLIAGPETAIYRVQKFVRKHAGSVAMVVLVALAVVLGLVVSTAMYFRAERMRIQADQARQQEAAARAQAEQATKKESAARAEVEQAREKEAIARTEAEQAGKLAEEQRQLAEQRAEDYRRFLYVNSIQLADAKYREGHTHRVRELLTACPNDLRGWEWDRLNYTRDESIMTLLGTSDESVRPVLGKDDCIYGAILNPDGKQIVSGHHDGVMRVWDSMTGERLKELRAHDQPLLSMAVSSNGRCLVSGSLDMTIKVWDTQTFKEIRTLQGHQGPVRAVAVSPDGRVIASSALGERVFRLWDAQTGSELTTLGDQKSDVERIAFSPDGTHIISGDNAGDVKIWDTTTGGMLTAIHAHPDSISCLAVNSDGSQVASACMKDNTIKVWDALKGVQLRSFHGGQKQIGGSLAFSPDNEHIASGWNSHIRIWELETGSELQTLRGHEGWLTSLAFSLDGNRLISSSWAGTVKLWDVSRDHEATRLMVDQRPLDSISIAFSPDAKRMASNTDGMVKVWDVDACVELMTLHEPVAQYQRRLSIVFSPDGRLVGATIPGGTIKIWDAETSAEVRTLRVPSQHVWDLAFSPDNQRLAAASVPVYPRQTNVAIQIWDVPNGGEIMTVPAGERLIPFAVAFSPDGKRIASGLYVAPNYQAGEVKEGGAVKVWDASNGTELMTMIGNHGTVLSIAFSPDGKLIASGNHIATASVWSATTGAELLTLRGTGAVYSVEFSPDGRRLLTASDDKTAKIWDVATGAELLSLPCDSEVHCARFNAGGSVVAAGTIDGNVFFWDSKMPAGGFEVRNSGGAALQRVAELHQQLGFYHDVVAHLQRDGTLDSVVRGLALQIATSRKWEDAETLDKEAWETLSSPDKAVDEYRAASEKVQRAHAWEPNDPGILNTLGASQYRLGSYAEALKTLRKADRMLSDAGDEPDPTNLAFTAMALYRIDRLEEAKAALERLRELGTTEKRFFWDRAVQDIVAEAEKLIASEQQ